MTKQPVVDDERFADTPKLCVCFNVRKASRAITQLYDDFLQPSGLKSTQYSVLVAISMYGESGLGALARGIVTDRTTLTRNLKPLINQGLVEDLRGADKRTRMLRLTAKGRQALKSAFPLWLKAQDCVMKQLGDDRFGQLREAANGIVEITNRQLARKSTATT